MSRSCLRPISRSPNPLQSHRRLKTKAEKPPEQKPKTAGTAESRQTTTVLKRVFQYGEKDTGPKKSLEGSSAQDNTPAPAKDDTSKPPVSTETRARTHLGTGATPQPKADPSKADEKPATVATDEKPTQSEEKQATEHTDKQQPDKQEAAAQTAEKQAVVTPKPLAAETGGKPEPPTSAEKAKPKPAKAMKFKSAKSLRSLEAKCWNVKSRPTTTLQDRRSIPAFRVSESSTRRALPAMRSQQVPCRMCLAISVLPPFAPMF